MKVDKVDIAILKELWNTIESESLSTTGLAKKVFGDDIGDVYDLRKKDILVRRRLKKWLKLGVVSFEKKNDISNFFLVKENIKFGKVEVRFISGKEKIPFSGEDVMLLKDENRWNIYGI